MERELRIVPGTADGFVTAPPSKSVSHRALILASLCMPGARTELEALSDCDDVRCTAEGLRALGVAVTRRGDAVTVWSLSGAASEAVVDCGESASSLRFLIPYAAFLGVRTLFRVSPGLRVRPVLEFANLLGKSCSLSWTEEGLLLCGKCRKTVFRPSGKISSQFASGLLMAAPLAGKTVRIICPEKSVSFPYIELTARTMERFGFGISRTAEGFEVEPVRPAGPVRFRVEGDWSQAAFWLCLGALRAEKGLTVRGLDPASAQGDREILKILASSGAGIETSGDSVTVRKCSEWREQCLDVSNTPDLFPLLAVLGSFSGRYWRFYGLSSLRHKESDRVETVGKALSALGVKIFPGENDEIFVCGRNADACCDDISGWGDHRIVFAETLFSLGAGKPICIHEDGCTRKSWPSFADELRAMGLAE